MQGISRIKDSRIVKGFVATVLGSGTSKAILAIATFLFAHLMTKMEFGEFSFVRNTLNTILCMCALNFSSLCTKFTVEASSGDYSGFTKLFQVFRFSFLICVFIGILLIVLPMSILDSIFTSHRIAFSFKIVGVLLPVFMLQPLIEGIMRGMEDFRVIGIFQTVSAIVFVILVVIGYRVDNVNGAIGGVLTYYSLYSISCLLLYYKKYHFFHSRLRERCVNEDHSVITKMILPIFIMSFFEAPILWLSQLLLSRFDTMEAVGSMTAIMQLRNLAILIPNYFSNTFLTFVAEMNSQKDYSQYFNKFKRILLLFLIVGITIFLFFLIFGKWLLSLYGSSYIVDWDSLIVASLGIPIIMLINIYRVDLVVQEHQKELLYSSIIWNIAWIAILYLLLLLNCPALFAFFASQLIGWIINLLIFYHIFKQDKVRFL